MEKKVKESTGGKKIKNFSENIIIILAAFFFSEKRTLADFTFELFTTFSQIIHPFQDFRIWSLVTMWRLPREGKMGVEGKGRGRGKGGNKEKKKKINS